MKTKVIAGVRHGIEVSNETALKWRAMRQKMITHFSRSHWPMNEKLNRLVSPICRI